ncbi:hypothetical protein FIBSPDRAFT_968599 [Athelia psychrophila]|uniref:Uncharacterized protein n=1 Tax=Athelia psychrophila TaxID=1759441 RepID=A0A167UFM1_9AGAM|nr:hypothetical protein FIBSPDRAFT_968599 [Fibularhizoctonia sp. CBS 109695]
MAPTNASRSLACYHLGLRLLSEDTVAATLADIRELDREILRFEAATEELRSKRTTLQSFANNHKSHLPPVTRLPVEALSQIFQQGAFASWLGSNSTSRKDDYDSDKAAAVYECDKTPLIIASVSRQRRNVALSTLRLWSVISLVLRPKHTKRYIELDVKHKMRGLDRSTKTGPGFWLTFVAFILLLLALEEGATACPARARRATPWRSSPAPARGSWTGSGGTGTSCRAQNMASADAPASPPNDDDDAASDSLSIVSNERAAQDREQAVGDKNQNTPPGARLGPLATKLDMKRRARAER